MLCSLGLEAKDEAFSRSEQLISLVLLDVDALWALEVVRSNET